MDDELFVEALGPAVNSSNQHSEGSHARDGSMCAGENRVKTAVDFRFANGWCHPFHNRTTHARGGGIYLSVGADAQNEGPTLVAVLYSRRLSYKTVSIRR